MIDVLIVCVGSRGDVHPFVVLAQALTAAGASCTVAAHPEFEGFVRDAGCQFEVVRHSLPEALLTSDAGKRMREGKGGFAAVTGFFLPLFKEYFRDMLSLTKRLQPRIFLLTLMPYLAGGFSISNVLQQQRKEQQQAHQQDSQGDAYTNQGTAAVPVVTIMAAFTVPVHPTGAFLPGSAGLGFTAPWRLLNRFAWWASYKLLDYMLYRPAAVQLTTEYNLPDVVTWRDYDRQHTPQTLYCYSPALLPRPDNWSQHIHVVGPWLPHKSLNSSTSSSRSRSKENKEDTESQQHQHDVPDVLHEDVTKFISAARHAGHHVLYITLGSMLGCMFDQQEAERIMSVIAEAVQQLQEHHKCCAIIQCDPTAKPEASTTSSSSSPASLLWWSAPLPHSLLLPLVDLVVHHGGMGTTHAALAAGVPALIVPVAQSSDQPFWASIVQQRGLGRMSKVSATNMTAAQFASMLEDALDGLVQLKQAVTEFADVMRQYDGTQSAVRLIQGVLKEAELS